MEYSASETSCSSHMNLDDILKNDKVRYIRKGYGLIFAIIIALGFFVLGPHLMASVWPYIEDYSSMTPS
jgi:hypothetical protein